MRWKPWPPPPVSKKYEVKLSVQRLEVGDWVHQVEDGSKGLAVEIRWKGAKLSLGSFRRTVQRDRTREELGKKVEDQNGGVSVEWNEQFQCVCSLSGHKDNKAFHPWEISFNILHVPNQGSKNKFSVIAFANLNLSEYAVKTGDQDTKVKIPLTVSSNGVEPLPVLYISLNLQELVSAQEPIPTLEIPSTEKDEVSVLKTRLMKVKIFTEYVSTQKAKKGSEKGSEYAYPFDSELLEETEESESEVDQDSVFRKSFSYGTLAFANYVGVSRCSGARANNEDEDLIYYNNCRRSLDVEDLAILEQSTTIQNSRLSILPWRKRKLSFRSFKVKGEPLLKKAYAVEGGDDIDFDRRQLSSDESVSIAWHRTDEDASKDRSSVSEFGDDSFVVGTWEHKEMTSRDGHMKIQTHVFFASIDQRDERAAGESACTALVAVIADWLQNNRNLMPVKSQFNSLIRDGSLEWRNLCKNKAYMERFPDKHFDLETVINAKIRDICVVPGKSFVGFFHPDGMDKGKFDFLSGAMSFDSIWDEIITSSASGESQVFIVSWNDHFFVLKVESDAYYIIDTLGERLHEGCNQAYILKFDRDTTIYKPDLSTKGIEVVMGSKEPVEDRLEDGVVCQGKESCKEYIKGFLAAIPIRQLLTDVNKGLPMSKPLHHRLQIEFHFTQLQEPASLSLPTETVVFTPKVVEVTT